MKKVKKIIFQNLLVIGSFCFMFFLLDGLFFFVREPVHAAVGPAVLKVTGGGCCGLWPTNLTNVGGTLFFTDYDATNGMELWKSDGTSSGTDIVKDINPGSNDGQESSLTDVYGTLFFIANDGINGTELWKSDGTEGGTMMVKDINPSGDSNPWNLVNINGTLYFSANDGINGTELWKSDGTEGGTMMVKDINPTGGSSPQQLKSCNNSLFFTANDGTGSTIWKSDGTDGGTIALTLPGMATPNSLFCAGTTLYYTANNIGGATGVELGKTDGTDLGTVLVKDINPGGNSSYPQNFFDINGTLYFGASDGNGAELWKSDGTDDGTVMIKNIDPTAICDVLPYCTLPSQFFDNNGTVYFDANDGTNGAEVWTTDGTSSGTVMLKDINPSGDSYPGSFTNINGMIYFNASDGTHGSQLWRTDGTSVGTVSVIDTNSDNDNNVGGLTNVNNMLYFTADDAVNGTQLWLYIPPTPPYVSNVTINGIANVGQTVTGQYMYIDDDNSPEGTSIYRWLRDGNPILGATGTTYTLVPADLGTSLSFEVTPVAQNGMIGGATQSNPQSVSVPTFITINAPTKTSTSSITDTTIHATNALGIMATGVTIDVYTTTETNNLICSQTDLNTVDCTIQVDASGDLVIHTSDILGHPASVTESGYSITPTIPTNSPSWYNNSFTYRKEIIIDHTRVHGSDQLNFPVLISLTDSGLQTHARNDGHDILFTDSTGTVKIPYEREQYDSVTGDLVAWVNIPSLSHTDDTFIYMYYGNSTASDQQDFTGGTWDANFKGVWHFNDASPTTIADSTVNANTGIKSGTILPTEMTGKIGKAQSYDGIDESVSTTSSGTLSGLYTVTTWAKVPDNLGSHTIISTRAPNDNGFDFKFDTGNNIHGDIGSGTDWITTSADVDTSIFSYLPDTWYKITYTVNDNGYIIYVNGIEVAEGSYSSITPVLFDSDHNLFFGQVGYSEEWFKGSIDEVRVSDVVRSADWIKTEYNTENNPSAFYRLGNETYFNTHTLTYTAGAHGSIIGVSPQTINYGADGTEVTANPDPGYHFVNWDDASIANPRTDTNVTADISVTANFAVDLNVIAGGILSSPTSSESTCKFADINCEGKVDVLDFNLLMVDWGNNPTNAVADLNGDGKVDVLDFNLLMVNWSL